MIFSRPAAPHGSQIKGSATICSGQTGVVIDPLMASTFGTLSEQDVGDCGDVNGDGIPDIIIAEPGILSFTNPKVHIYSG